VQDYLLVDGVQREEQEQPKGPIEDALHWVCTASARVLSMHAKYLLKQWSTSRFSWLWGGIVVHGQVVISLKFGELHITRLLCTPLIWV
jgi:hypothetical protein